MNLIARLSKEDWEVFVITGSEEKVEKPEKGVFQQYNFSFDNPSIKYVLESAQPDLVLFMGAADTGFNWKTIQQQSVRYLSGLANLLLSCRLAGVPRFLYLSSDEVYEKHYEAPIDEEEPLFARSPKAVAIAQGEDLCLRCHMKHELRVTILRIAHLYGYPVEPSHPLDFCMQMCIKALKGETLQADGGKTFTPTFLPDAVDAVYRVAAMRHPSKTVYQISSGEAVGELQAAKLIAGLCKNPPPVEDIRNELREAVIVSNKRITGDLRYHTKYSFEEGASSLFALVRRHLSDFLTPEERRKRSIFRRAGYGMHDALRKLLPFAENLLLFIVVFIVVFFTGGNKYYEMVDFYLLYVVFVAVVHGKQQTVCSILLSSLGRLFMLSREAAMFDILVDYNTYVWVVQLFIVGMSVGYIKDKFQQEVGDKEEQIGYLSVELEEIKEINFANVRIKKVLEDRLINYKDSLAKIYSIVSKLDELEPGKVLFASIGIISEIMGSDDVSIYIASSGSPFCRMVAASSDLARSMKKSICFPDMGRLYTELSAGRVYINREMEPKLPAMAGAVYNGEELEIIIMIWSLKFEKANLYQANLLSVLCHLIFDSVDRAHRYIEDSQAVHYWQDTNIMLPAPFAKALEVHQYAREKGLSDFCVLRVEAAGKPVEELGALLSARLRPTDYLGLDEQGGLQILIANSNPQEAAVVIERFAKLGVTLRLEEE